jgi:hypothetical protein
MADNRNKYPVFGPGMEPLSTKDLNTELERQQKRDEKIINAEKKAEKKAGRDQKSVTSGVLGSLSSLVGLATSIGTAVPGLRKPNKATSSRAAAGEGASAVGRAAVGGAQTGFGATRGLNLRTGLRQASQVAKQTGGTLARAADADEVRFNRQNLLRQERLASFGADSADAAANIGLSIVEAQAAKAAEIEANQDLVAAQPGVPDYQLKMGQELGGQPAPQEAPGQFIQDSFQEGQPEPGLEGLPPAEIDIDPLDLVLGIPQKEELYLAAPVLEIQHRMENLAIQEAERQGLPIGSIYAKIQRMQNLPAVRHAQEMANSMDMGEDYG